MNLLNLHLPTFLTATLICYCMVGLQLLLALRSLHERAALRVWVLGLWLHIAAQVLLITTPGEGAAWPAILLANACFVAGCMAFAQAIHAFVAGPGWVRGHGLMGLGLLLAVAATPLHAAWRIPIVLLAAQIPCAVALLALWRVRRSMEPALQLVAWALVALALICLARGIDAHLVPGPYLSAVRSSAIGLGFFVVLFVLLMGGSFAFLLATLQRQQAQLEHLAQIDPLTECLNRRAGDQLAQHALHRALRDGSPLALLVLDIDHFKKINDRYGHGVGDRVLRQFAAQVRLRLRDSDVLVRAGGEEFSVLLPATDAGGALKLAEALRAATAALAVADDDGGSVRLSASIGVALLRTTEPTLEALYRSADRALYAAKRGGRNRVRLAPTLAEEEAAMSELPASLQAG